MKTKNKPRGTKHKIREKRIKIAVIITVLITTAILSSYFINSLLNQPSASQTNSTSEPKAAIVDQLSLTYPNQTFTRTATNTLEQAGYKVSYYPGEEVTVEFFKNLPTHDYDLIILRVHSSATNPDGTEGPVTLFTSERASSTKYVYEQLSGQLVGVVYSGEEKKKGIIYFGIDPSFVTQNMKGKFQNTIIIMMGCEGLDNTSMAKAFLEKGAKVYISWSDAVLASHTDEAITHLLHHFLIEKLTLKETLQETFKEIGADPAYNSLLIYYPVEAGDYTIINIVGDLITNTIEIQHQAFSERKNIANVQAHV